MSQGSGIPENATIAMIFNDIVKERLQSVTLGNISGIVQFDITGEGGGKWYIEAKDGKGELHEGEHSSPTTTFNVDAETYLKMARQELESTAAFMQGLLKVTGDMGIAMQLGQVLKSVMEKPAEAAPEPAAAEAASAESGSEVDVEKIASMPEEEFQKLIAEANVADTFNKYVPPRLSVAWEKYKNMMEGVQGIIQFDITGEGGGKWYFEITDQGIQVKQGEHDTPTTTFQLETGDYLAMNRREADPQTLFMSGKMKVLGDMGLAMRLGQVMQAVTKGA